MKGPAVYIMANKQNETFYTGVTSDLVKRVYQHRSGITKGFASRYGCKRLVFFEILEEMAEAIAREKQIKAGSRKKKLELNRESQSQLARSVRGNRLTRHCRPGIRRRLQGSAHWIASLRSQ